MKYRIKDEDGMQYEVEEIDAVEEAPVEEIADDEPIEEAAPSLAPEEIVALKGLAAVAEKLMKLIPIEEEEHGESLDEDMEEEVEEIEDEEIDEEEKKEELIDTCSRDSKSSFGSIEKQQCVNDSVDIQEEIANAWAKRYEGR